MIDLFTLKELDDFILSFDGVRSDKPYDENTTVYYLDGLMFALIDFSKKPIQISLRCDWQLGNILKDKYEEVIPAVKLNPKQWITILITGQLSKTEIQDLIRHSLELAKNSTD